MSRNYSVACRVHTGSAYDRYKKKNTLVGIAIQIRTKIKSLRKGFIVGTEGGASDTFGLFIYTWGWGEKDVCLLLSFRCEISGQ